MYYLSKLFGLMRQIIHNVQILQYKSLNVNDMYHSVILFLIDKRQSTHKH